MHSKSSQFPITRTKSPLSKSTTQFFQTHSVIDQFITQFFLPKKHDYSENVIDKNYQIPNSEGQMLHVTLFYKSKLSKPPQNCIVYCHGFGSTRLQAIHILKVLTQQIALCCFDFSGSGKSQGDITTYGAKEKEDIRSILTYLKQKLSFHHFVLWGRSMGATACLLYSIKYERSQQAQQQNVIFQVVDSPFVSFETISLELAKKFISMPYFGTNIVLDMMKKHCKNLKQYDPFSVNLDNITQCKVPTLFVYSQNDEIVNCKNSEELTSKFTTFYQKMIISQKHNVPRTTQTLSEIIKKIEIQLKKCQISKKNGIAFRSFISTKSNRTKSNRKGIERSYRKNASLSSILNFQKPSLTHHITQYEQPNHVKSQTPNPHTSQNFFAHQKQSRETQYFTNKPISLSTFPHQFDSKKYHSPFTNIKIQTLRSNQVESLIQSSNKKTQALQNIYQMQKPKLLHNLNGKELKKSFNSLKNVEIFNPLTSFSREKIPDKNSNENTGYRSGQRRSSSTSKKINISLSKLRIFKDKEFVLEKKQKLLSKQQNFNHTETNKPKQISSPPYISMALKSMVRPISRCKDIQPVKSVIKTNTPTTKAPSLSSSMDNLHFLGALKFPSKTIESRQKILEKNLDNSQEKILGKERQVRKIRSSQNIFFDKNVYSYGL